MSVSAAEMLTVVEGCLHPLPSEWIFLRELRAGAGQRLDAFALNCFTHMGMKRICYEVKTSRADFLCEMKQPVKRRIGLRYSNEFYFVTPVGLLGISEVPIECGLIEVDPAPRSYCRVTVPAPWRETPGPTWQFVAGMLRNQQRSFHGRLTAQPKQQRFVFIE